MNDFDTAHAVYDLFREAFPTAILWVRTDSMHIGVGARLLHHDLRSPTGGVHCFLLTAMINGPDGDRLLRLQVNTDETGGNHPSTNITLTPWLRPLRGPNDAFLWVNQLRQDDNYPEELDEPFTSPWGYQSFPLASRLARNWSWHKDCWFPRTAPDTGKADIWFPDPTSMIVRTPTKDAYHLEFARLGDPDSADPVRASLGSLARIKDATNILNDGQRKLVEAVCARYLKAQASLPPAPTEDDAPLW